MEAKFGPSASSAFELQSAIEGWIVQYPIGYMGIGATFLTPPSKVFKDHLGLLLSITCCHAGSRCS